MVVRIRLARFGKRNAPFYNIVVAHARYGPSPICAVTQPAASATFLPAQTTPFHFEKARTLTTLPSTHRTARNSKPLEVLGTYDPIPKPPRPGDEGGRPWKDIKLDTSRAKYWLGVGAQPSDPAWRLLSMAGLLEPRYRVAQIQEEKAKLEPSAAAETSAAAAKA
ncbi:37S ribosomal protein S16, mitochondrial [Coniosporium apollinis]|uniref:37S ribosomal protein S16, mitochondrial n=1 Tax=Coniosporium apollinis TaxID=61459 RepID=A0ABQ9NHL2_9PEZI|nr:37S ribosomal protein S16, mitochondrial [Coniosporium apollinis]